MHSHRKVHAAAGLPRTWPVMYEAASEARKDATWPISHGSPTRPMGVRDSTLPARASRSAHHRPGQCRDGVSGACFTSLRRAARQGSDALASGGARLFMAARSLATAARTGVMMEPGPMALTRMLCGASDSAMFLPRRRRQRRSPTAAPRCGYKGARQRRPGRAERARAAPGEVVHTALGRVVAGDGGDGHHRVDRGHVDDGAAAPRRRPVLLHHLPRGRLAALRAAPTHALGWPRVARPRAHVARPAMQGPGRAHAGRPRRARAPQRGARMAHASRGHSLTEPPWNSPPLFLRWQPTRKEGRRARGGAPCAAAQPHQEDALEVDADDRIKVLLAHVQELGALHDARVGHHDVHAAKLRARAGPGDAPEPPMQQPK